MNNSKREIYGKIAGWVASEIMKVDSLKNTSGYLNTAQYIQARAKVEALTDVLTLLREHNFLK